MLAPLIAAGTLKVEPETHEAWPHHEGILHKLLSKPTQMPVIQAEDGTTLEPDHAELTKSDMEHGITGSS